MKIGTMIGLAIGDALGAPWEFNRIGGSVKDWDGELLPHREFKAGQWTDDTKMAIQLAVSLIQEERFDPQVTALHYVNWYNSGDLRGIGSQTNKALSRIISGEKLSECGKVVTPNPDYCGNGTIMRVAPIGVFFRDNIKQMNEAAGLDAVITHAHQDAIDASVAIRAKRSIRIYYG